MSHRKRPRPVAPSPPPTGEGIVRGFSLFIVENVRTMLIFFGIVTFAQAVIPWTNSAWDRIVFGVAGAAMLGLALPRRFWVR